MTHFLLIIVSLVVVGFILWAIDYAAGMVPMLTPFRTLVRVLLVVAGLCYIIFEIIPALGIHIIGM